MARIELSDGQWAQMMDVEDVTSGRRKALFRAIRSPEIDGPESIDLILAFLLVNWSYSDYPCPTWDREARKCINLDSLDELKAKDVDAMSRHASATLKVLTPDFDPNPNPTTPTSPSGD